MIKLFQVPATIQGISTLRDRTLKITAYISKEISGDEKAKVFDLEQCEGWLLFSPNELQEKDVPKEPAPANNERKTATQRLYNVMFVYHSQNFSGNFEEWRQKEVENIINHYKARLH
jgi:hypothetical protein